jgi:hypothetical protein
MSALLVVASMWLVAGRSPAAGLTAKAGPYEIEVTTDPSPIRMGPATVRVRVADADGKAVTDAQVQVLTQMPGMSMGAALFIFLRSFLGMKLGFWAIFFGHIVWALPFSLLTVLVLATRSADFSFPSDHAVMAGAVAVGLVFVSRRLAAIAGVAALAMAFAV